MAPSRREIYAEQYRPTMDQMLGSSMRLPTTIYGFANPSREIGTNGFPLAHALFWMGKEWATILYGISGWEASTIVEQEILDAVGYFLMAWYE